MRNINDKVQLLINNLIAGVKLAAGTSIIGKVSIDQVTASANQVVVKSITAGNNNIGDVDIASLPAANLGQKAKAASVSIAPATDITDATYIGDIKFAEPLPAGEAIIGKTDNIVTQHTFHDAATVAADGTALTVGTGKTLAIEISGTSTGRTVQFFGLSESDTKIAIMGIKLATLTSAVSTTGTGELWQFDVTGLKSVIIRLEAITDNNVTVKGRLVS